MVAKYSRKCMQIEWKLQGAPKTRKPRKPKVKFNEPNTPEEAKEVAKVARTAMAKSRKRLQLTGKTGQQKFNPAVSFFKS